MASGSVTPGNLGPLKRWRERALGDQNTERDKACPTGPGGVGYIATCKGTEFVFNRLRGPAGIAGWENGNS